MKKLLFLALFSMIMVGCKEAKNPDGSINAKRSIDFNIVRVDSCEYLNTIKALPTKETAASVPSGTSAWCVSR